MFWNYATSNPDNKMDTISKEQEKAINWHNLGISKQIVTLTGTTPVEICDAKCGVLRIMVKNLVKGGPSTDMSICKSEPENVTTYQVNSMDTEINEKYINNNRLCCDWEPNEGVKIFKVRPEHDGEYKVMMFANL